MRYRTLGRSGLQLTSVGLGSWITYGGSVGDDVAQQCVDRAWELGVRFYDTANVYAAGRAEAVFGRALSKYPPTGIGGRRPNDPCIISRSATIACRRRCITPTATSRKPARW